MARSVLVGYVQQSIEAKHRWTSMT